MGGVPCELEFDEERTPLAPPKDCCLGCVCVVGTEDDFDTLLESIAGAGLSVLGG